MDVKQNEISSDDRRLLALVWGFVAFIAVSTALAFGPVVLVDLKHSTTFVRI